jgi:hypothetical protein
MVEAKTGSVVTVVRRFSFACFLETNPSACISPIASTKVRMDVLTVKQLLRADRDFINILEAEMTEAPGLGATWNEMHRAHNAGCN